MKDEFKNRLARHRKVIAYLNEPANSGRWAAIAPFRFGTLVSELTVGVEAFSAAGGQQSNAVSWDEQNREERELEDIADALAQAFYDFLLSAGREAQAAEWDMNITKWRKLTEEALLAKALRLHTQLTAELAATPTIADDYNLSAARIAQLNSEYADYHAIISKPVSDRSGRAGLTGSMRPRMRILDGIAKSMDRLILSYRGTPEGDAFVDGYFIARRVDDLGHGPGDDTTPPPAPTP